MRECAVPIRRGDAALTVWRRALLYLTHLNQIPRCDSPRNNLGIAGHSADHVIIGVTQGFIVCVPTPGWRRPSVDIAIRASLSGSGQPPDPRSDAVHEITTDIN